jgi:hypothetical protein
MPSRTTNFRRLDAGDVSLGGSYHVGGSGVFGGRASLYPGNEEDESSAGNDIDSLTGGMMFSPRKAWVRMNSFRPVNNANPQETPSSPKDALPSLPLDDVDDDHSSSQRDMIAGAMQRQRRGSIIGRVGAAMFQTEISSFPDDDNLNIMSRYVKAKSYPTD